MCRMQRHNSVLQMEHALFFCKSEAYFEGKDMTLIQPWETLFEQIFTTLGRNALECDSFVASDSG
ncbi:hypothetical protein D1872_318550 [compost metagenome]